jgi:hypothetical protein
LALFFYFFIIFFLPFGVNNYNPNHEYTLSFFLEIFYFFVPLLVFALLNEFALRPLIFKQASVKRIIIWSVWTLFLLSSVVFFTYNFLGEWHDFKVSSYGTFLVQVSVVLLFPLVGTFFFFRHQSLQHQIEHILTAKEQSLDQNQLIQFKGQGSKDQITLSLSNFLYGKAQDNYVQLFYLENRQLKQFLIRCSISNLSEAVNSSVIVRCHRSYLVNLIHVTAIKGANHDLTLTIQPFDSAVPVSKSYRDTTLAQLHKIKNFA